MILEGVMNFLIGFVKLIVMAYGMAWPAVPDWVATGVAGWASIVGVLMELNHWVNVPVALSIGGVVIAVWLISISIQLVRTIVSYMTLGGGAT